MSRNCLSGDQLHQQSYAVNSLEIIHRDYRYVVFAENEDFHDAWPQLCCDALGTWGKSI